MSLARGLFFFCFDLLFFDAETRFHDSGVVGGFAEGVYMLDLRFLQSNGGMSPVRCKSCRTVL